MFAKFVDHLILMKLLFRILLVFIVVGGVWGAIRVIKPPEQPAAQARLVSPAPTDLSGYERATGPLALSFPADFGPHPGFQTEWWYYTGNLAGPDDRHFGYQLTFFRRAILPPDQVPARTSDYAAGQVYLAHFALTDVGAGRFQSFEKVERGAAGLSGAQGLPELKVWLDDWSVQQTGERRFHLKAASGGMALDLDLSDPKGPVLEGDRGYSQKGPDPGNASIYFSQTHLETAGHLRIANTTYPVSGLSWMDHEFGTSALSPGQVGWDWFALQLSDGSDLMVYSIRLADGSVDPYSSGTLVAPDGTSRRLARTDFKIAVLSTWKSAFSQAVYPARWQIDILGENLTLRVDPYLADQEHHLTFLYWEGAVKITGSRDGQPLTGSGYVELTGYAGSLAGQF